MSFSDVQKAIEAWPPDEQDRLAGFLTVLRLKRDSAYMAEIDRRLGDKDPAHWLTLDQIESRLKED